MAYVQCFFRPFLATPSKYLMKMKRRWSTYSLYRTHPRPFDPRLRKKKKFKNKKEFVPEIQVYSREKVWLHDTVWLESDEKMRNKFNEAGAWQGDELCRGKQLRVREVNQLQLSKDETLKYCPPTDYLFLDPSWNVKPYLLLCAQW